jgi:hypothetical protein
MNPLREYVFVAGTGAISGSHRVLVHELSALGQADTADITPDCFRCPSWYASQGCLG